MDFKENKKENKKIIRNRSVGSYLFRIFFCISITFYIYFMFYVTCFMKCLNRTGRNLLLFRLNP